MLYKVSISVAMLAVIIGMSTVIFGCANQQKDDTEQETVQEETALTVATEEVSLNVTGMV